mmetsp:Transcript_67358/g.161500  ORF Transcript_67358/g.161500 Transcript_67358/m.161500 type:complete len:1088 (+) Transcript_67358:96-3359(+)
MIEMKAGPNAPVTAVGGSAQPTKLTARSQTLEVTSLDVTKDEEELSQFTDVSIMKGAQFKCAHNASMMVTNFNYICYSVKEGSVRVINQQGTTNFKVATAKGANAVDICMGGSGKNLTVPTNLMVVDEATRLTGYRIPREDAEASLTKWQIVFNVVEDVCGAPQRVVACQAHPDYFLTMHSSMCILWSHKRIEAAEHKVMEDFQTYSVAPLLRKAGAGKDIHLPEGYICRDVAFSVDGLHLFVLAQEESDISNLMVFVFKLNSIAKLCSTDEVGKFSKLLGEVGDGSNVLLQKEVAPGGSLSLRVLGDRNSPTSQVLVIGAQERDGNVGIYVHDIDISQSSHVLGQPLQYIKVGYDIHFTHMVVDDHDPITLMVAFNDRSYALALLLTATGWKTNQSLPISHAMRVYAQEPITQVALMRAQSYKTGKNSVFFYKASQNHRPKDGKIQSVVRVGEVMKPEYFEQKTSIMVPLLTDDDKAEPKPTPEFGAAASAAAADDDRPAREPQFYGKPIEKAALPAKAPISSKAPVTKAKAKGISVLTGSSQARRPPPPVGPPPGPPVEAQARLHPAGPPPGLPEPDAEDQFDVDDPPGLPRGQSYPELSPGVAGAEAGKDGGGMRTEADYDFVKQISAFFVKNLDKRRDEMADKLAADLTEMVSSAGGDVDRSVLEAVLTQVRQTRETQASTEKAMLASVRQAADKWTEASAQSYAKVLQKELTQATDGLAANVAQQLAKSRKFSEALASGVQKVGSEVAKEAVESVSPSSSSQDAAKAALVEALQDTVGPVFRKELRTHLEKDLVPVLSGHIAEMMSSLQSNVSQFLDGIAKEQEESMKSAAKAVAAAVSQELQDVDRLVAQRAGAAQGGVSEAQLDELASAVQAEVILPLQTQVAELRAEVQQLQASARQMEQRWREASLASQTGASSDAATPASIKAAEASRASDLERQFQSGQVETAFMTAIQAQRTAKYEDFLGRLCALAGSPEEWLENCQLSNDARMLLMLALAQQLDNSDFDETILGEKLEWISELYIVFKVEEKKGSQELVVWSQQMKSSLQSPTLKSRLSSEASKTLRQISKSMDQVAKLLGRDS